MRENQKIKGYMGILCNHGISVDSEEALAAALEYCGVAPRGDRPLDPAFAEMVVEWAFSGNWMEPPVVG